MGCNCKKRYNQLKGISDNKEELEQEENELNQGIINSVAGWVSQFIFGIITICVFIVVIVPLTIYIIVCIILGKEPSDRIRNPKNIFRQKYARED